MTTYKAKDLDDIAAMLHSLAQQQRRNIENASTRLEAKFASGAAWAYDDAAKLLRETDLE